ncbi:MAG: zinc ribbon domain-containing protein [Butyrivibrio sp.]|nr:zinc ribbon domain-containing protein [Acetatifactor muris]MCM1558313.1 zinc ribbon domain-containing protein [Butyrivibrio sp.]
MVCKNCGKELPEGTKFCTSCGTPCEEAAPQTAASQADAAAEGVKAASETVTPAEAPKAEETKAASEAVTPAAEVQKAAEAPKAATAGGEKPQAGADMKKLACIGGAAVVVLVLLIVFCNLIFGSSPKKAFKAYVTGQYTCDYKKILNNSIYTKKAMKALDLYDKDDYEDDLEDLKDYYEDLKDDWKDDGIKYKVSIDVKDVEKIKKSDREFKWAKEFMEDYYDCDADKIKQFAIVEARVKAEYYEDGDRDKDNDVDTGRTQYLLVKIGGDWYMTEYSRDDIKDYLKYYK